MLKLQNTHVDKVIKGYCSYSTLRERAQNEGIPFEELQK